MKRYEITKTQKIRIKYRRFRFKLAIATVSYKAVKAISNGDGRGSVVINSVRMALGI